MADNRRRRWVAHDVYFLDGPLGEALYDRYGATGVALWFGFIAAAKKNHIEGRISYATDAEALAIFGLPGLPLTDPDGHTFTLDDFFRLLGDHKVTRRTSRGRLTQVVCTRWAEWQNPRSTRAGGSRPPRSDDGNANKNQRDAPERDREVPSDLDPDLDPDTDLEAPLPPPSGGEANGSAATSTANPRATGTSPRQTGTNPRAAGKQRAATERAASYGRTLAAGTDRHDALAAIDRAYPDDPRLIDAAIDAYDATTPETADA